MTGKIDVNCVISKDFSGDLVVKTKAIVKNMKQSNVFEKDMVIFRLRLSMNFHLILYNLSQQIEEC